MAHLFTKMDRFFKSNWKDLEYFISLDTKASFYYAKHILNSRFPLGELAIAKDGYYSFYYAKFILKDKFQLGEPAIAKNSTFAYQYSEFINERFEPGEPAISMDQYNSHYYAWSILKSRFKLCENNLGNMSKYYVRYILGFNHE